MNKSFPLIAKRLLILFVSILSICLVASPALAAKKNYKPTVGTIIPSSGISFQNQAVSFTTTYSDANGWQDIQYVHFLINTSATGTMCFYGYYNQNTHRLYLRNDRNKSWLGGYAPSSNNIIENS